MNLSDKSDWKTLIPCCSVLAYTIKDFYHQFQSYYPKPSSYVYMYVCLEEAKERERGQCMHMSKHMYIWCSKRCYHSFLSSHILTVTTGQKVAPKHCLKTSFMGTVAHLNHHQFAKACIAVPAHSSKQFSTVSEISRVSIFQIFFKLFQATNSRRERKEECNEGLKPERFISKEPAVCFHCYLL